MAAKSMPLPVPPRTPSPASDEEALGLGITEAQDGTPRVTIDSSALLPEDNRHQYTSRLSQKASVSSFGSYDESLSPYPDTATLSTGASEAFPKQPFTFKPVTYSARSSSPGRPVGVPADSSAATADNIQNVGQRRGHKYKNSSVAHAIFLEPAPKAPLRIPASLPIPTAREGWKTMSKGQKLRLAWCICHLSVAAAVQYGAHESLAATALSHLMFYDAIGACLAAGVDILSNFDVWNRTSIRHPFGLERSELLVGFSMSILLMFMGFDLISHNTAHILNEQANHTPHRAHAHAHVSPTKMCLVALLAIVSTLISALMLNNHARIAKNLRLASISLLPSVLSNPSHLLTLSCSVLLLLMPMLGFHAYMAMDKSLSIAMALSMCVLGFRLGKNLGAMLLMSYPVGGVSDVLQQIEIDPAVKKIEEAKFWQVHYGLCMANLKLRVEAGSENSLLTLRDRIQKLVKSRLGGGYGQGAAGQHWEVSTQLMLDSESDNVH